MKAIEVRAKEWFDKVNGNSYFAGVIVIDDEKTISMPFQYGYGDQYIQEAKAVLTEHNYISAGHGQSLWSYCKDNGIVLTTSKQEGCKKSELNKIK